ncbi:uncharacterized protein LOC118416927 [Branchiostoma floridae]|uniref:Uncharacterized protein LOC118416927 n=1 Tax=Branchiostoma floridae TaxID=7739 RepID=A0A9J7MSG6_BRAFL|nr:uncharacterized protein LOC118416927 [Branchiostoma floridae]
MAITVQMIVLLVFCIWGDHTAAQRITLPYHPGSCCFGGESGSNADTVGLQRRVADLEARQAQMEARQAQLEVSSRQAENTRPCPEPEIPCEWKLVFKIQAKAGPDIYPLWSSASVPANQPDDPSLSTGHYISRDVGMWESLDIKKVKVSLYTFSPNMETRDLIFNGTGSNKDNWFSKDRLISSPWTDLKTTPIDENGYVFSIVGHVYHGLHFRRFFINRSFLPLGCPNDRGWMVVLDQNSRFCPWERGTGNPRILFSKLTTHVYFETDRANVGQADVMAIFIKTCDD